jgi:hypothetical protein
VSRPSFIPYSRGLIGYVGVKYEDKKMARNLLLAGIVISVIYVVLVMTLYQLQSILLAVFVFGLLFLFLWYGLPEVPKSTK